MDACRDSTGKSFEFYIRLLVMLKSVVQSLERILYVWAIRHPASGYVQGINDLVTPFFQIFLSAYIGEPIPSSRSVLILTSLLDTDPENFDPSLLPFHALSAIEADSFWCLSRLLDGIQDNYIFAQPGIQRSVKRMAELIARIDGCRTFLILILQFIIFSLSQLLYRLISNHKTSNSCSSPSVG